MRLLNQVRRSDDLDDIEEIAELTAIRCLDDTLTKQSFAEDCDLNVIAARYGLDDGSIPPVPISDEILDFTDTPDLRSAMDRVHDAQERFMSLPAKLRSKFNNDPRQLHDWVLDQDNYDEALKLGFIAKPKELVQPTPPSVTPTTTPS